MKNILKVSIGMIFCLGLISCEKVDPFVDRDVSPVLIQIKGESGSPSSGLSTDPTVSSTFGTNATLGIYVLELDKTNILDFTKGIDSIPVAGTELTIKFRGGSEIGKFTTDASGTAAISIPWSTLGVNASGKTISLSASGKYKDVSFTKLFKLSSK
jgi:hypothetical protein